MKLVFPEIETVLETELPGIQTVVIENMELFRKVHLSAIRQSEGFAGPFMVFDSRNDKKMEFSANVDVIDNVLSFDINRRTLITKICTALEREAVSSENMLNLTSLL